jgi:Suppressor of fused protein (SUFU)
MTELQLARYWSELERRLKAVGMRRKSQSSFDRRITDFDSNISVERWTDGQHEFLFSKGCSVYPGHGRKHNDEFVIETSMGEELALKLLTIVVYYHLTLRPVSPADVLEIGRLEDNAAGFSHVFVSVPFFFPGDVNFIRFGEMTFVLDWLMPIFREESEFISAHGSDDFEQKLNRSGYDWFDLRSDFTYLKL